MEIQASRRDASAAEGDALVVLMPKVEAVPRSLRALDTALGGRIKTYLERGGFSGKAEEVAGFPIDGFGTEHVVLAGIGPEREVDAEALRRASGSAIRTLTRRDKRRVAIAVPMLRRPASRELGQALAEGAVLGGYRFDQYRTLGEQPGGIEHVDLLLGDVKNAAQLRAGVRTGVAIAESVNFARDLSNEPGSVATPAYLAAEARKMAREVGLRARVLGPKELAAQKLEAILAVGRGSANAPRLIALEYSQAGPRRPTIALVGKGVTFDSGGISIKPAAGMDAMKGDMSGGAAVLGAMRAIALLKLPLHVVGVVGAAQNMPDGEAYVPGDVIKTAAGPTIEILNTDAEGRVVLADALHYATQYDPVAIIDVATLTGAKVIALGSHCCAVIGNDDKLSKQVQDAGDRAGERAWPLPLWPEHKRQIRGDVGDLKNTGGREAGSITPAALLSYFVGETRWAHLDIAGNEMTSRDQPYCPKGATGFGVRLLVELLRSWR